jgi:hypothetical protein
MFLTIMNVRYLPVVFCLFITCLAWGRQVTLRVIDADLGIPLEGVTVTWSGQGAPLRTNQYGMVTIPVDDSTSSIILTCTLPGYDSIRYADIPGDEMITVSMRISSMIKGEGACRRRRFPPGKRRFLLQG